MWDCNDRCKFRGCHVSTLAIFLKCARIAIISTASKQKRNMLMLCKGGTSLLEPDVIR